MKKQSFLFRWVSCMLAVCLLCGVCPNVIATAYADTGAWEYCILDSGDAQITGYTNKNAATLQVPLLLDGVWVRGIATGTFDDLLNLRTIKVPATVTLMEPDAFPANVTIQAYHGTKAHAYAQMHGLSFDDLSTYEFMPSVLDLSDMTASMWSMTESTVRISQPFASLLSAGSQIYLPPKDGYQQGRPVLVETLTMDGDDAVLTVSDLAFADTIASFSVKDSPIVPDYSTFVPAEGVNVDRSILSVISRGASGSDGIPVSATFDDDAVSLTVKAVLQLDGGKTSIEYSDMSLKAFDTSINVTATDVETIFSIGKESNFETYNNTDFNIVARSYSKKLGSVTLTTGYGLVHINVDVYITIEGKMVEITMFTQQINATIEASWSEASGLYYDTFIDATPVKFKEAKLEARFGFELEISITFGFVRVDSTWGPNLEWDVKIASLKAFFGYDASIALLGGTPCLDLHLDLILEFSGKLGWLGKETYTFDGEISSDNQLVLARWEPEPIKLVSFYRHYEECKVWQDSCTYLNECTFYFVTNCETEIDPITLRKGETPRKPANPTRKGYQFVDWYTDEACTLKWYPEPAAAARTVIYAKWRKNEPTPTPTAIAGPTPTPTPSYDIEVGGSVVTVPFQLFPSDLTLRLLTYEYDAEYGGYAITGYENARLIDYSVNPDGSYLMDYSNYYLYENGQWTIAIPASINGIPVVSIRGRLPGDAIFFPDSIRYIGNDASYAIADQYLLNIPANLEYVANRSIIYPCFIDTDVVFPPTLKYIGWQNFTGSNATSVTFQGCDIVLSEVFAVSPNLTTVDLGNAVSVIGSLAFRHCPIEVVRIPASVTQIESDAFINIHENTIVKFIIEPRDTQLVIGSADYYYFRWINLVFAAGTKDIDVICQGDVRILYFSLPEGVTSISRLLPFMNNEDKISLELPDSLVRIGVPTENWQTNGISGSNCLTELILSENLISIEAGSFFSSALRNVVFNEKLEYIGAHAFEQCGNLNIDAFPDSLTFIGEYAFADSAVGSSNKLLTFPAGNCQVEQYAFSNVWLNRINVPGDIIAGEYIFGDPSTSPLRSAQVRQGTHIDAYLQQYYPNVQITYIENEEEEKVKQYTVTFDTRGLAKSESMKVAAGELIPVPADPVGDSRQFTGWYKDSHCLHPWEFSTDVMPERNLTLYAGWKYVFTSTYLVAQDEITLTQLIAPEADTVIPSTYENKVVIGLGAYCIPEEIVTLTLPRTLKAIDPAAFDSASGLQTIIVDEQNEHFYAVDGVLYAASGTLVCYPQAKTGKEFTAARNTTAIAANSFCRVQHLSTFNLPASVKDINSHAFDRCNALTRINLTSDVTSIAADAVYHCSIDFFGPQNAPVITAWADSNGVNYNCYTLIFHAVGKVAMAIPVRLGERLPTPPESEIGLQHVSGWSTDKHGIELWDFASGVMPGKDLTLYAVWAYDFQWEERSSDSTITLTCYTGHNTTVVVPQEINGKTVAAIAEDCFGNLTGLTLVGDAGSIVESYAQQKGYAFQRRRYTVTYVTGEGSQIAATTAAAGAYIPLPAQPPSKNNHVFNGWYESELGYFTADVLMPARDVYLHAQFYYVGGEESADGLLWEEKNGEVTIIGYTTNSSLTIPAVINGLPVTAIASGAFASSPARYIRLPESIVSIGEYAFRNCTELTSVTVPSKVTELEAGIFYGCLALSSVNLPQGLQSIEQNAFGKCLSLTSVTIPASVVGIDPQAFSGCKQLQHLQGDAVYGVTPTYSYSDGVLFSADGKTLVIYPEGKMDSSYSVPDGVTTIGKYAMQSSRLIRLHIPASVTTIEEGAVQLSEKLETLSLTSNSQLTSIGKNAFIGCRSLTTLYLPDALQEIGSNAFTNTSLTEVRIGGSVRINDSSFNSVSGLVLYGPKNTRAHQWALENDVRFIDPSTDIPLESISIQAEILMVPGGTFVLAPVIAPSNATERFTITYSSSKPYVASVDETGVITAHSSGIAVITAMAATGVTAQSVVTVVNKVPGDANADGTVDVWDALLVLQYCAGWNISLNMQSADANKDGVISISDALHILEYCTEGDISSALRALKAMADSLAINLLEIVEHPVDQSVAVGQRAQFAVCAAGDSLEYQWYINRNDGNGWCELKRATSATYVTSPVELDNDGCQYRCVIKDAYGSEITSDTASLYVVLELPNTSDASEPLLYALAMLFAGVALLFMCTKKRAWR